MRLRSIGQFVGWMTVLGLLAPVLFTFWVSFSPNSFLTPPTGIWSTRWYRVFLSDRRWTSATGRSLTVAVLSAMVSVLVAAPASIALHRAFADDRRFLTSCLLLPALVPPAALGTGLLPLIYLTRLWGTNLGMILVHTTLGVPIALLIIRTHLTRGLLELECAAQGLGAKPWDVIRRITLPLLSPALLAAGISVFVLSLNESLVSLFLSTPSNETLPSVIWPQLRYSASPLVAVASCVTTVTGIMAAFVVAKIVGSRFSR